MTFKQIYNNKQEEMMRYINEINEMQIENMIKITALQNQMYGLQESHRETIKSYNGLLELVNKMTEGV